jgi:hypothetical protein
MRLRGLLALAWIAALAALAPGCLSPTLPLPPPVVESVTEGDTGSWEITGECLVGGDVLARNESTGNGQSRPCSAAGFFSVPMTGAACDVINVVELMNDDELSSSGGTRLQPIANGIPINPGACH